MYDFEKETRRYNELLKRILPAYKEAKKELLKVRDYAPTNGKIVNAIKLYNRMEADMAYLQDGVRVEDWRKGYIPMTLPSTLTHLQNIVLAKYDVDEYPALKRANDEFKKRANEAFRLGREIYNTVMRTGVSFGRNTMRRYGRGYRGVRFAEDNQYIREVKEFRKNEENMLRSLARMIGVAKDKARAGDKQWEKVYNSLFPLMKQYGAVGMKENEITLYVLNNKMERWG